MQTNGVRIAIVLVAILAVFFSSTNALPHSYRPHQKFVFEKNVSRSCSANFINFDGESVLHQEGQLLLARWGKFIVEKLNDPRFDGFFADDFMDQILGLSPLSKNHELCPTYPLLKTRIEREMAFVWMATVLAHIESQCFPQAPGGGLYQLEVSAWKRIESGRAPECQPVRDRSGRIVRDIVITRAEDNIACMIGDLHKNLVNPPRGRIRQQWGPLVLGNLATRKFIQLVNQFPLCDPAVVRE